MGTVYQFIIFSFDVISKSDDRKYMYQHTKLENNRPKNEGGDPNSKLLFSTAFLRHQTENRKIMRTYV